MPFLSVVNALLGPWKASSTLLFINVWFSVGYKLECYTYSSLLYSDFYVSFVVVFHGSTKFFITQILQITRTV